MSSNRLNLVIQHLRRTLPLPEGAEPTDGELLECFVSRGEKAALEDLVRRHGPMVWGVCRRFLASHHDAEDAFQATFVVLVRRAGSVVPREKVANWLYGVALQTARKARATAANRQARERQVAVMPEPEARPQGLSDELQPILDDQLSRLPDKYRVVFVLCELEGKSRKEAARHLGLAEGTVASRLARGKEMLAKRLARHGLAVPGAALAGVLSQQGASAGVPPSVLSETIRAVTAVAAGQGGAGGLISPRVSSLAEGVMRTMMLTRVKVVAAVGVLALGLCGVTGVALGLGRGGPPEVKKPAPEAPAGRGATAKPARESKLDEEFTKLRKARLALAQKGYAAAVENLTRTKRFQNVLVPVGKPEDVYNWSIRWLQAERDMIAQRDVKKRHADEVAALEAHLKRMTKLKKAVTDLSTDLMPKLHVDQAEWYRLEAELWLLGEKNVNPLAPG